MIINEKGLVKAMKESYKGAGYSVAFGEGIVRLAGHSWSVRCRRDELPRKALGLIAEHLGKLPKDETALCISNAMGIQSQIYEDMTSAEEITEREVRNGHRCTVTGLTLSGYDLWQVADSNKILLADPEKEEMWVPASMCMASDDWMGIRDENSAVYIRLETCTPAMQAKLNHLAQFKWTA